MSELIEQLARDWDAEPAKTYLTITPDGRVVLGDDITMDEAAEQLLRASSAYVARLTAERDAARAELAALADWAQEEGGWRLFYYAALPIPPDTFDLSDRFNPEISERLRAFLAARTTDQEAGR